MSEYQYYEFQAIYRPLTAREQAALRKYSSRATITSSRFAVDYSWGDFKGNAAEWMEKYFDAFLYLANWGTHELMLRLPRSVLPLETAKEYCAGDFASVRARGDHLVLRFCSEDEGGTSGSTRATTRWRRSCPCARSSPAATCARSTSPGSGVSRPTISRMRPRSLPARLGLAR